MYIHSKYHILAAVFLVLLFSSVALSQDEQENLPAPRKSVADETSTAVYTRHDSAYAVKRLALTSRNAETAVSNDLVRAAVGMLAAERWKQYAIGQPIPCSDDNGALIAYQVPVAINTSKFPKVLTPLPADQITTTSLSNPRIWGADKYWTFVVSAHETDFPVPVYGPGLPPYLVTYHKAQKIARLYLNACEVDLTNYYTLGHRGDFFEFRNSIQETVLINAYTLIATQQKKVLTRSESLRQEKAVEPEAPSAEERKVIEQHKSQVSDEWRKVRQFLETQQ